MSAKKPAFEIPVMDLDLDLGLDSIDTGFANFDLGLGGSEPEAADVPVEKKVAEIRTAFMQRTKNEAARVELVTDTEFWCCLCFETREQKDNFLKAAGLFDIGDKYLDGRQVARKLGIDPGAKVQWPKTRAHSQRLEKHITTK
jgi:hypothetical protein